MPFYELTLYSTFFGQRCVNVFNYVLTGTPAAVSGSFGLIAAFGAVPTAGVFPAGKLFQELRAIQSDQVVYNQLRAKNPYDDIDFYSRPFASGVTGTSTGDALSPTAAYSLRSNQTRLDIQAGQKRFVGVLEDVSDSGGNIDATFLAGNFQDLADVLSAPLTYDDEGNTLTYTLVVAKKYSDLEADPPIINAYWPTLEEQLDNVADGLLWTPRPYTSTQTTRQYGRGR